jgi:hypothetical protein
LHVLAQYNGSLFRVCWGELEAREGVSKVYQLSWWPRDQYLSFPGIHYAKYRLNTWEQTVADVGSFD